MAFGSPLACDVALLGTGVAPLVAASRLIAEGKSVLLLNPEWDYFGENSELSLDPFWPTTSSVLSSNRMKESAPESTLELLRPDFPGAIELWPKSTGYHDPYAPHVRTRSRLWIQSSDHLGRTQRAGDWDAIEEMYLRASDEGLKPQTFDGILACRRFPGYSASKSPAELRGILLPKLCDVDVSRYQNGLREFIRERVPAEKMLNDVSQLELTTDGIRFRAEGSPRNVRVKEGLIVFWTPRLTPWVLSQAKKSEVSPILPRGIRLWEEWSLVSRDPIDPSVVGMFENMVVWAEGEGIPDANSSNRLAVLRAGALLQLAGESEPTWATAESFKSLTRLCHDFLKWEKYSVRSMKPRAIFEWPEDRPATRSFLLQRGSFEARVFCGGDGPLMNVVKTAREASLQPLGGGLR